MATPRSQRIGIWIIAIVLAIGTVGSFFAMILGTQNQAIDTANLKKIENEYQTKVSERDKKVEAQSKELSATYYPEFSTYESVPAAFNGDEIKELTKNDLKVGDGAEIKKGTEYSAYYIGWDPKGVIFDQSISDGALKEPISGGSSTSSMILGWDEGVIGMKTGGVRELSIPSDKAYGEKGNGSNIAANTPIKFVIMIIPKITEVPQVTVPQELLDYYQSQYSGQQ
jgi:FKBP-type peptidyl-prolyl cis-trans isomerase